MNKIYTDYSEKLNNVSVRERALILVTVIVLLGFIWWNFFVAELMSNTDTLIKNNRALKQEIHSLKITADTINQRINQGVNKTKQQQLALLIEELGTVKKILKEMTLELIEPDEMFSLMQQLIFADSNLKLTGLKRKQVLPAFSVSEETEDQPEIYRHVMHINLEGTYKDILSYIERLEDTEWKLLWDRISLKTQNYPVVKVDIEISTLSGEKHWIGL